MFDFGLFIILIIFWLFGVEIFVVVWVFFCILFFILDYVVEDLVDVDCILRFIKVVISWLDEEVEGVGEVLVILDDDKFDVFFGGVRGIEIWLNLL